jgi:hypothetical protein
LNAALTGQPRTLTIVNAGSDDALDVNYLLSPTLPSGTTVSPASCGTLAAGDSCVLTVTPGNTASAAAGDTNPVPIVLTIAGSNTNTLTPTLNILTYGSVYQGGYVFAIDDSAPNTASMLGKVAALTDQAAPASGTLWASDGTSGSMFDTILGVDQTSTTSSPSPTMPAYSGGTPLSLACNGATDGVCNTDNIVSYYNFNRANGGSAPTPLTQYAAGLCKAPISGYSDWHLPAICEMGYDGGGNGTGCGNAGSPTAQNMQSNLVDNGDIGGLAGDYWSSTEVSFIPNQLAFIQTFATGAASAQDGRIKDFLLGARCARALTN